jgi:hypothetical protein
MTYQHPLPMLLLLIASFLMLAACQGGGSAQGGGAQQNSVESTLRAIAAGNGTDLSVVYDDMHGLWGGQTIAVSGSGAYERKERARGDSAPTVTSGTVGQQQIRQLAGLLVDLAAWEQRVPERAPVPDESRATLRIRVGTTEVTIWEWFNDLPKNARIAQIRDLMRSFGGGT